jgi:hypothetical protein
VSSKTFEEHKIHLNFVLQELTRAGFTVNLSKCKFFCKEIKFLGRIISQAGVAPDPDRIDSVRSYPAPKNQNSYASFLELATSITSSLWTTRITWPHSCTY